jgi:pimeloyl-ACP methyl ester carboxylesterase
MSFAVRLRQRCSIVSVLFVFLSLASGSLFAAPRPPRTIQQIKVVMMQRAEEGMYPMIGISVADAKLALSRIKTRNPNQWAAGWISVGDRYMADAKKVLATDPQKANEDYLQAWRLYSMGGWPVQSSPGKMRAYLKAVAAFRLHARFFKHPMHIVHIPFEGKQIVGYLSMPSDAKGPSPVVIVINGLDSRKEERFQAFRGILKYGVGEFAADSPGGGQAPVKASPTASRMFSAIITYLRSRPDVDKTRIGVYGGSLGGYWAAKLAFVEHARLRAVVAQSPPVDGMWTRKFLMNSIVGNREYPFDLAPALMTIFKNVKTLNQMAAVFPSMSLVKEHVLHGPNAPLLIVGGAKDTQVPISDTYLLLSSGQDPKYAWVNPQGGHMGRESKVWPGPVIIRTVVIPWLLRHLDVSPRQN